MDDLSQEPENTHESGKYLHFHCAFLCAAAVNKGTKKVQGSKGPFLKNSRIGFIDSITHRAYALLSDYQMGIFTEFND